MKVLENNRPEKKPEYPKVIVCRTCASKLEIVSSDVIRGTMVYSQREIDYNVDGVNCPCCNQFTAL